MAAADVLAPDSESLEAKPKIQHRLQIMESHMPSAKEKAAIEVAISAVESNHHLMDIASHIKTKYDKLYPGSGKATEGVYHAMCGTHFATCVSHETREYLHLKVDQLHIVIWKSKDTPFKPDLVTKD